MAKHWRSMRAPTLQTLLQRELSARNWSAGDLSDASGGYLVVQGILEGKEGLSQESAEVLADITGMSAESWLALETTRRRR